MTNRTAQVVAVHPTRRTVDVCFTDNGQRMAELRVMTNDVSTDGGSWTVPDVPKPPTEGQAGGVNPKGRTLVAVVGLVNGREAVIGWHTPEGAQLTFKEQNRQVHRHPSGAYTTVAPDGSIETWHPSGAYFRIGTGAHQDMAPLVADGNWKVPAGAAQPTITLAMQHFNLTIAPDGTVTMNSDVKVAITAPEIDLLSDNVNLGGTGGKKIVLDGDPTSDGAHVIASSTKVKAV